MCPWCDPNVSDDYEPEQLCRPHLAEHAGLTLSELDRMQDEQSAELADLY